MAVQQSPLEKSDARDPGETEREIPVERNAKIKNSVGIRPRALVGAFPVDGAWRAHDMAAENHLEESAFGEEIEVALLRGLRQVDPGGDIGLADFPAIRVVLLCHKYHGIIEVTWQAG